MYYKELLVKVLYIDAVRVNAVKFMYFKNYEISKGTYMTVFACHTRTC